MTEINKANQLVELLSERINQLQESALAHEKKYGDIHLQQKNDNLKDEAEQMKMNHELRLQVQ